MSQNSDKSFLKFFKLYLFERFFPTELIVIMTIKEYDQQQEKIQKYFLKLA